MKKLFLEAIFASITLSIVSCADTEPSKTEALKLVDPQTTVKKIETFSGAPELIFVSKITTDFTPYPKCDGGECYDMSFIIGLKIKGKYKVIPITAGGFVGKKGTSKIQESVVRANYLHKKLRDVDPKKIVVTLVDGEITKIVSIEEIQGSIFNPETILWETGG